MVDRKRMDDLVQNFTTNYKTQVIEEATVYGVAFRTLMQIIVIDFVKLTDVL